MNKDTVYSTDVVKSAGLALLKPADFLYSGPDEDHYFNLISTMKANGLYAEE